jgi:2-phospho-L-lactate/phosphoenolpyruvate guanylyltransferase
MSDKVRIWAVVPVKRFSTAKSRLAIVLDAIERAELARLMFEDVLESLAQCKEFLAGIIVVTSDESAAALARSRSAMVVSDTADNGINAAVRLAIHRIDQSRDDGVIIVPSDIPQLSLDDIFKAVTAISAPLTLAVVPATEDGGTNLLACRPADAVPLRFGPHSFDQHCRAALFAGITPHVLAAPALGLDIDRPENLRAFLSLRSKTRTHAFLSAIHIVDRLEQCLGRNIPHFGWATERALL